MRRKIRRGTVFLKVVYQHLRRLSISLWEKRAAGKGKIPSIL